MFSARVQILAAVLQQDEFPRRRLGDLRASVIPIIPAHGKTAQVKAIDAQRIDQR